MIGSEIARNQEKAARLLEKAMAEVPFYRDRWRRFDPGAGHSLAERYAALPALTKADMRASFPDGLVPAGTDVEQGLRENAIEYSFTSGTTGEKVINLWNQGWWHAAEAASWKLHPALADLAYPARQATLASSLNVGISCEEDLPMDHRIMDNLLYLNEKANILCWKDYHMERIAQELNTYRPTVLEANPSLLARCCWYWLDHGISVYAPQVITLTYELPSQVSLAAIRTVFDSPVVSSYGTTETGFVLESGPDGRYYQNTECCRVDFLPLKAQYGGPALGRLLVTTFDNPWAFILRFDVGDIVRVRPGAAGENGAGFVAEAVEGRAANATFTTAGGLVTTAMADAALAQVPGIRDYDLSQTEKDRYALRLKLGGNAHGAVPCAEALLRGLYGADGRYTVTVVRDLLPGPSGKYRRTHAAFAFDDWSLVEGEIRHA
jgi:phenylacetate-coenzyme A ligase PaaK-like adenylate-forming protein